MFQLSAWGNSPSTSALRGLKSLGGYKARVTRVMQEDADENRTFVARTSLLGGVKGLICSTDTVNQDDTDRKRTEDVL